MARKPLSNAPTTAQQLRSFVDRQVRLKEQIKELQQDVKDISAEAAAAGFDRKVLGQMVKETMMDEAQRKAQRDYEEICEVYRASLGMLRGTPLGEAARKRIADASEAEQGEDAEPEFGEVEGAADATADGDAWSGEMRPEDVEGARENGRAAARSGEKIFANPYLFGDPRRAAWDEGHCETSGSDGMEIPDSWRRRPKKAPRGDEGHAS